MARGHGLVTLDGPRGWQEVVLSCTSGPQGAGAIMPPNDEMARHVMRTIRRVALVLVGAGFLVISLLVIGFGGHVALGFYLLLAALAWAAWLLVRARLSLETYAFAVMGTLTALFLLIAFGPDMVSAAGSPAGGWLLLVLFVLPLALWIWLAVRKMKGR